MELQDKVKINKQKQLLLEELLIICHQNLNNYIMEIKKKEYQRKTGGTLYGFNYRGITAEGDYALGVRLGRMLEREGKKR